MHKAIRTVMTDKALPAFGADADKVGSESVELWFRLARAAVKRNRRRRKTRQACLGKVICWVLGTALASGDAALWYRARDDGVGVMAAMKSESLDVWWPWRRREGGAGASPCVSCLIQWMMMMFTYTASIGLALT